MIPVELVPGDTGGDIYNHRSGVGYSIPYDWQGHTAHYFPDFIVRAKWGEILHNFIIEVKGRLDDKDKAKAERGRRWCETLTQHDDEPWHYLMLVENKDLDRLDISWWQNQSIRTMEDLLRRHECLPLIPEPTTAVAVFAVLASVPPDEEFRVAVPVFDLAAKAGSWGAPQVPQPKGWARVEHRQLDSNMFVARVTGRSMEPAIVDGCWGLFRAFPAEDQPSPMSLDGRRVLVRLASQTDAETGSYTLKRWKVAKTGVDGLPQEIALRADNLDFQSLTLKSETGEARVVAEFLEVLG